MQGGPSPPPLPASAGRGSETLRVLPGGYGLSRALPLPVLHTVLHGERACPREGGGRGEGRAHMIRILETPHSSAGARQRPRECRQAIGKSPPQRGRTVAMAGKDEERVLLAAVGPVGLIAGLGLTPRPDPFLSFYAHHHPTPYPPPPH